MITRSRRLAAAAAIPMLLLALGGCAGSSSPNASGRPSGSGSSPRPTFDSLDDYRLAITQCIRDSGVDVPDPGTGGGAEISGGSDPQAFLDAADTCSKKLGRAPAADGSAQTDEERQAQQLKQAKCLRDHGVDVPDPEPGQAGAIPEGASQKVLEACLGGASKAVAP